MAFPDNSTILDNFNRTENPLASGWVAGAGDRFAANGSTAYATAAGYADAVWNTAYATPINFFIKIPTKSATNGWGGAYIVNGDDDGYMFEYNVLSGTDQLFLYRYDGVDDSHTQLGSTVSIELAAGNELGISIDASGNIIVYTGSGGTWTSRISVTNTVYSGPWYFNPWTDNTTVRFDDFGGGTVVATLLPIIMNYNQKIRV